jgi:hypothetical protein
VIVQLPAVTASEIAFVTALQASASLMRCWFANLLAS